MSRIHDVLPAAGMASLRQPGRRCLVAAIVLAMTLCLPMIAAAEEADDLAERLAAYQAISLDVGADELQGRAEEKERALSELGGLLQRAAREADPEQAAAHCFQLAEMRRALADELAALDNPFEEGSDDHEDFADGVQLMLIHGLRMEASSSLCGYASVVGAAVDGDVSASLAIQAYEAWRSIRPEEARSVEAEIEMLRRQATAGEEGGQADDSGDDAEACSSGATCEEQARQRRREGDDEGGVALLRRACELEGERCIDLGYIFLFGAAGQERDLEASERFFERACNAGNREACVTLAGHLQEGVGFEQNEERAREFFDKACEGRDFERCLQEFGIDVPR